MLVYNTGETQGLRFAAPRNRQEREILMVRAAQARYNEIRRWRGLRHLWARLTGRQPRLLDLAEVEHAGSLGNGCDDETCSAPIRDIRGSEGRGNDFDADFCPLNEHTRDRWVGIACAWITGVTFPPVDLIRVGDVYYVRDGHHRISVAKAMGQQYIDARVTVWRVSRTLSPAPAARPQPCARLAS